MHRIITSSKRLPTMRPLYATRFRVTNASFLDVVEVTQAWVTMFYEREEVDSTPDFCPVDEVGSRSNEDVSDLSTWMLDRGDRIETRYSHLENEKLFALTWEKRSNNPGVDLTEKILANVFLADGEVRFDIRSVAELRTFRVAPLDTGIIQRPRIVDRLVETYTCQVGQTDMYPYSRKVTEENVPTFLSSLTADDRALPVVLLSHDASLRRPIRDPDWIQNRLMGLANVFEIAPSASADLTERVGDVRTCAGGDVRVYWPGFNGRSRPADHPYFTPSFVKKTKRDGKELEDVLFDLTTRVATERYQQNPYLRAFKRRLRLKRRQHLADTAEEIPDEWAAEYDAAINENERLSREVESLEERLEQAYENLRHIRRETASGDPEIVGDSRSREDITSPMEAIEFVEERFGRDLYVWRSARKAASKCSYHDPEEIVEALEAIADLAKRYREQNGDVGPWSNHFSTRGLKYAVQESESTMNQYGAHRTFRDGDREKVMERHITIGQGHEHCLQIFFDRIQKDDRFQVGYCGEHLPFTSDGT